MSRQRDGATLLRRLEGRGLIDTDWPLDGDGEAARIGLGFDFPRALARHSAGVRDVRRGQAGLTLAGSRADVDGDFGPATEAAVRDLPRRCAVPVTGTGRRARLGCADRAAAGRP